MLRFLRALYVLLLAGFVIMFVIFGIMAFYPGPLAPQYSRVPEPPRPSLAPGEAPEKYPEFERYQVEQMKAQQEFEQKRRAFEQENKVHRRNVFFIAFPLAVLAVGLGLLLPAGLEIFRSGLALGGAGLVIYAVVQAQGTVGNVASFLAVAVGLVFLVYLGYRQLVQKRPPES